MWKTLKVAPAELNLDNTLFIGQVFNWVKVNEEYVGCIGDQLVRLKPTRQGLEYIGNKAAINTYFNLDVSIAPKYAEWSSDSLFKQVAPNKPGVRILKQPLFECIICFICSQNSHIKRITKNIESLRQHYGRRISNVHDQEWHAFPTPEQLSAATELELRNLGLGYRAKYIALTCAYIVERGSKRWVDHVHSLPYEEAKDELMQLAGVGPKVADCIALFALNFFSIVPIDVHMWRIAKDHYLRQNLSLNDRTYKQAAEAFEKQFGKYAGWAHSILYAGSIAKQPLKRKRAD